MGKVKLAQTVPQLPVKDVERTQFYYQEYLGFEISWITPDKLMGSVHRDDAAIFFAKTNQSYQPNIHWIFSENVDQSYTEFKNKGVEILEEIENKPWKTRQFAIRDLNGHVFYIHHDL